MTTFSFSTGNPTNLTGGATASMTDISGSLTDLKTFINGSITDTNVTAGGITDTSLASPTSTVWRTVATSFGAIVSLSTTPAYFSTNGLTTGGSLTAMGMWVPAAAADIAVAGKTTRLRTRVAWAVNGTNSGITLTWGLYPVNTAGGGAGVMTLTLGTVVAGSTAAVASPTAGTAGAATGSSFDLSAVTSGNLYVLGVVGSGTQTANSNVACQMNLEMRHT